MAETKATAAGAGRKPRHPHQDKVVGSCPGCGQDLTATLTFSVVVGSVELGDDGKPEASTSVTLTGVKIPAHVCDGKQAPALPAADPTPSTSTGPAAAGAPAK